jgi:hypothetical protein
MPPDKRMLQAILGTLIFSSIFDSVFIKCSCLHLLLPSAVQVAIKTRETWGKQALETDVSSAVFGISLSLVQAHRNIGRI